MSRPQAKELTERELEVLQVFWDGDEMTASTARDRLAAAGIDRAYVTIANLVRILVDKGYLRATNHERPFTYTPVRSREEVSHSFVGDLLERIFGGSREKLLVQLLGSNRRLTPAERKLLEHVLKEQK